MRQLSRWRCCALVTLCHVLPVDVLHVSVDIARGLRAVVDVIRMLVHVEGENDDAVAERSRMVRGPLIDKLSAARRVTQQHPSRPTALGFAHRGKLRLPLLDTAEIACK